MLPVDGGGYNWIFTADMHVIILLVCIEIKVEVFDFDFM